MPDSNHESSGFRVVDRRSFKEDGSRRSDAAEREPEAASARPAPRAASPAPPATSPIPPATDEPISDEVSPGFETLVSYLSTTALLQLGLLTDPSGIAQPPDVLTARRTIGALETLQEKTRGNLTRGEAALLEGVLYELHLSTVEIEERLTKKIP